MTTRLFPLLAILTLLAAPTAAERVVRSIEIDPAPVGAGAEGATHRIATLPDPGVGGPAYLVRGRVRTQGVEGAGYLEMWSEFGAHGRYFSRTLASAGPLRNLEGTQDWRAFALPFLPGDAPAPESLELAVVFPGAGEVWLEEIELVQLESESEAAAVLGAPLGLPGGLSPSVAILLGSLLGGFAVAGFVAWRRQRTSAERRRMAALDAGGGIA